MGVGRRWSACLVAIVLISAGVVGLSTRAQSAPDDPGYEFQWGLSLIGVQDAWAIGRGRSASVAVLDTGVDLVHEDLTGRLLSGGRNTHGNQASPQDDNGEGTHVAGIIAASTNNGTGVAGIAHEGKVLPIKVLDSDGDGLEVNVVEGMRLAIEKQVDVMVVNLDAGIILADGGLRFKRVIRDAWAAGVIPVLAADHAFVRSTAFADAPALVVGAVTRDGRASPQSQGVGGAQWGLSAPGGAATGNENDIFSTYLPGTRRDGIGGSREYGRYGYAAGGIQAAAHVAGAAAILRGLGQTPQETVDRLLSSATDAGVTGRDRVYGMGVLDAGKSVRGLSADRAGTAGRSTPTTAETSGAPSDPSGPAGPEGAPRPGMPSGTAGPPPASPGSQPAAEVEMPPVTGLPVGDSSGGDEAAGGLTAQTQPDDIPGRTPLLPLVALLLLVGSGTIAWALSRRTLRTPPPINS